MSKIMFKIFKILILNFTILTVGLAESENLNEFDIRYLTGEPNYKSVNLTWEVEINSDGSSSTETYEEEIKQQTNIEFPKLFQIYYCEIQSFGPHRCRSKIIEDNSINENNESIKQYSTLIENLRMATKYSFHIKPQLKRKLVKITGRMNFDENEIDNPDSLFGGETIIIPTKGFTAAATKCLPEASEIEVETGPYFGGKIVVDNGVCGIKGDPKNSKDKYVMRIDHATCGSLVKPETNTVETFITVQENLGIFTHSTRRFVVVCTFQSGMQTVRASFTVPGRGGVTSIEEENDPFIPDERVGRSRHFRYVNKTELVLKETNLNETFESDSKNPIGILENIIMKDDSEVNHDILSENLITEKPKYTDKNTYLHAKYARLVDEHFPTDRRKANYGTNYTTGVTIACSLSVIMIGVFLYVLKREIRRQNFNQNQQLNQLKIQKHLKFNENIVKI